MAKIICPLFPNGISNIRYRQIRNPRDFTNVAFISNSFGKRARKGTSKNDYEIWATIEFIEDFLHLPKSPTEKQIKEFAVEFIRKRFSECGKVLPEEYGAFCSNTTGIKLVEHSGTLLSCFKDLKSAENNELA